MRNKKGVEETMKDEIMNILKIILEQNYVQIN
jgi:hypothetical protein